MINGIKCYSSSTFVEPKPSLLFYNWWSTEQVYLTWFQRGITKIYRVTSPSGANNVDITWKSRIPSLQKIFLTVFKEKPNLNTDGQTTSYHNVSCFCKWSYTIKKRKKDLFNMTGIYVFSINEKKILTYLLSIHSVSCCRVLLISDTVDLVGNVLTAEALVTPVPRLQSIFLPLLLLSSATSLWQKNLEIDKKNYNCQ